MHINRLTIENLRSLETAELDLNTPGTNPHAMFANVNVVLGANGFGKTTVLRAAVLAVLGPLLSSSSGFVAESLIRRRPGTRPGKALLPPAVIHADVELDSAELPTYARPLVGGPLGMNSQIVSLGTSEILKSDVSPGGPIVERLQHDDSATAFFMVAYGATRRVEASSRVDESARLKQRLRRYERVAGLFEDHVTLVPLSYWLPDYETRNKGRYSQVISLINELLPEACRIRQKSVATPGGREHLFDMNGVTLPFRALSDGYRAYIGWIGDMLFHLCMGAASGAKLVDTRGVVLVDEIDLHLHPEWQRVVLPTLSRALPNVQFIVTTHSPLVVGSLEATNLFTLVEQDGAVTVKRLPEDVYGRSAEQILLSPYFGLDTTRAAGVSTELETLAQAAVNGDADASMRYLRLLSSGESAPPTASKAPLKKSAPKKSATPPTSGKAKKARQQHAG